MRIFKIHLIVFLILALIGEACKKNCPRPSDPVSLVSPTTTTTPPPTATYRTITLRQDSTTDGDTQLYKGVPDANENKNVYNEMANWTRGGNPTLYRALMKFDLSAIQSIEKINSAILYITPRTTSGIYENSPYITKTNNNDIQFCLVTSPWQLTTVTWNTQPTFYTDTTHSLFFTTPSQMPATMQYDLTLLVSQIAGKSKTMDNNGLLIKMAYEEDAPPYDAMAFCSMGYKDTTQTPYLVVKLQTN